MMGASNGKLPFTDPFNFDLKFKEVGDEDLVLLKLK